VSRDELRTGSTVESKVARGGMVTEGALILRATLLEVIWKSTLEATKDGSVTSSSEGAMLSWSERATTSGRRETGDGVRGG